MDNHKGWVSMNEVDFIQDILVLSEKSTQVQAGLSEVILRNDARIRFSKKNNACSCTTVVSNSYSSSETIERTKTLQKRVIELESQVKTFKQLLATNPEDGQDSHVGRRTSFKAFIKDGEEAWESKLQSDEIHPAELTNKVKRLERSLEENKVLISKLRSKNMAYEEEIVELREMSTIDDPTRLNSGMALLMEEILKLRQRLGAEGGIPQGRRESLKHMGKAKNRASMVKTKTSTNRSSTSGAQYNARSVSDREHAERLEDEVEVLVLRVKELQEQNENLSIRSSQMTTTQSDSEEMNLLRAELDKARREAQSAQKFSLDLQKRLQTLRNENITKARDDDMTRLVETLSARNSALTEQLKQREVKMKESAEERRELKSTNLELNDAITRLSEQIYKTERERDMNIKWRSIANDRGADVNKLAQENATLRNEGISENAVLRQNITNLETEMNYMRADLTYKDEALREALRIHEEREEYLEKSRKERSGQAASASMLQAMMEENRMLEEKSKAAEEEAETLRKFMEANRGDRANESKAIGVLKLGLSKEQDKNRSLNILLNKQAIEMREGKKDLLAETQRLREKVAAMSVATHNDSNFVLTESSAETNQLKRDLVDKENEIFNLGRELQHAREELVRTRKQWEESKGNISVMVRVMPGHRDDEESVECDVNTVSLPDDVFQFERVFSQYSTQTDVFEEVMGVADMCLEGEKVAVIAMGAQRTGKSFTLLGERKQHGVIPRAIQYFLNTTQELALNHGDHYSVQGTFLGISDGEIFDLLALNAMRVSSPADARRINFEENNLHLHKIFEAVGMENEHASRVFTIYVQCDSENGSFSSSMSFFDLDTCSHKVLLDCLSGRAKALLLMHVDPSASRLEETTATLQFADKAQNVHLKLSMDGEEEMSQDGNEMGPDDEEGGFSGRHTGLAKTPLFTDQNEFVLHM